MISKANLFFKIFEEEWAPCQTNRFLKPAQFMSYRSAFSQKNHLVREKCTRYKERMGHHATWEVAKERPLTFKTYDISNLNVTKIQN